MVADSAEALDRVRAKGVTLCQWRRRLDPRIVAFLAAQHMLMPRQRQFRLLKESELAPALDVQLEQFLDRRWFGYAAWRQDLLCLLELARRLSTGDDLRVRLETVSSNACRLFHSDLVALRLITTYRGPGTEWLPAGAVDPRAVSRRENQHVLDYSALGRLGTGDVALMKGDRYPGHVGAGLMHRSPPVGPAHPRIVLAIDFD